MKIVLVFFTFFMVAVHAGLVLEDDVDDEIIGPECCPKNEEYQDCGTSCPDTCDNYDTPRLCSLQCVQGCFCIKDYVRDRNGDCVPKRNCKRCKDPNAKIMKCANPCPGEGTCRNPLSPYNCKMACIPWGCSCKNGYVKITDNGQCIRLSKCPKHCKV